MGFFQSGAFWFIEGLLAVVALFGFRAWAQDRKIEMTYWKWGALGTWAAVVAFSIAFVFTSLGENEATAATMGAIIFGAVSLIGAVGLWRLLHLNPQRKTAAETETAQEKKHPAATPVASELSPR